jgi:hypothetical protein
MAILGAALLSVESWALGPLSWIYGYGGGLETIPSYLALSHGDRNFSLWAPFVGGGMPRLAFWGNADPVSPEQWLFATLPIWLAYGVHRFLQYFVMIFFTARVVREQLDIGPRWGTLAGWLGGAFAYQTTGALFTISGVPLLVWLLDRLVRPTRGILSALVAGSAFSLLTTFTFSIPYMLLFAAAWMFLVRRTTGRHALVQFGAFATALIVADSPQLLAVMTSAGLSHRAGWPAETIEWSIDGLFYRQLQFDMFAQDRTLALITLNLPGLVLLAGAPLLWAVAHLRPCMAAACARGAGVLLLYAVLSQKLLWLGVQAAIGKILPSVAGVYMGRFYQIPAAFLIACMLTIVGHALWQLLSSVLPLRALAVGSGVALIGFMALWPKWQLLYPLGVYDWGEKNYQIAALDDMKSQEMEPFRVASVLPLQPAYAYAQGLECADGWANLFPAVYRDLWLRANQPLLSKLPAVKNVFDPETGKPQDNYIFLGTDLILPGLGALPGEDVHRSLREGFDVEARFNLNLLGMLNVKYLLSEYPLRGCGLELVHAPACWPAFPQSRDHATGLVHGPVPAGARVAPGALHGLRKRLADLGQAAARKNAGKDIFIYRLRQALPRFRFVDEVSIEPDGRAVLDRLSRWHATEHRTRVALEAADAEPLSERQFAPGAVRLVDYRSDRIELAVRVAGSGFLVVGNTWDPYWRATAADGSTRTVVRVNHAQLAILVEPEDTRITLSYVPPYSLGRLRW